MKYLYKYPQAAFPYAATGGGESPARHATIREFELLDTGVFDENRYFDVFVEYAKGDARRHSDPHHASPIADRKRPTSASAADGLVPQHLVVGQRRAAAADSQRCTKPAAPSSSTSRITGQALAVPARATPELLFTENETNASGSTASPNASPLRQGRHQRLRRPRRSGRGESRDAPAPRRRRAIS